jgi:hypothetical protein
MAERIGRPPRDPYDVIAYEELIREDGVDRIPVRVIDAIESTLRANGFMHDAAARAGLSTETLRQWRRKGVEAAGQLLAGKVRRSDLDVHTRRCVELADRMDRAEADARVALLGQVTALAQGGLTVSKIIERVNVSTDEILERRVEIATTLPDIRALTWLLSRRYPHDFPTRIEVTGPEGGPVQIQPVRDRLLAAVDAVRQRRNGDDAIDVEHRPANGDQPALSE